MLKQLKIENFRCFKSFELNHLGKVNLLVGKNNSGKTSILEAINLLCSNGSFSKVRDIMVNRGEQPKDNQTLKDISLIFNTYSFSNNSILIQGIYLPNNEVKTSDAILEFKLVPIKVPMSFTSINDKYQALRKKAEILKSATNEDREFQKILDDDLKRIVDLLNNSLLYLSKEYDKHGLSKKEFEYLLPLVKDNISEIEINKESLSTRIINNKIGRDLAYKFVNPLFFDNNEILNLFSQVILQPEENLVYEALQIIEPKIQRIAPIGTEIKENNSRGGFYVKLSDSDKRIPIGSMGDGVWRMLGLSLALVAAKDGVLLVDEIDTGLHYTALEDMWKMIWETAKKLNVQVFATTHSRDCWESLEVLANRDDVGEEDISIQRIEKDTPRSVVFNKKGIATAATREIEVR